MDGIELLRPRLHGPRFEDGAVALDFLQDLHALGQLIKEVVKWCYMQDHPQRQRLPRHFIEDVDLKIADIIKGSATPVIRLTTFGPLLSNFPVQHEERFDEAVQCIIRTIDTWQDPPDPLAERLVPPALLTRFKDIGRNLHADEYMELQGVRHPLKAQLDQEARQTLLERSQEDGFIKGLSIRGNISAVDRSRGSFELHTLHGKKVKGPLTGSYQDIILEALRQYNEGAPVQIQGPCRFDRQNRNVGFQSIGKVAWLDPLDVPARLHEFQTLSDGWYEGHGLAPKQKGLDWLSRQFDQYFSPQAPLPYTYPTPEGGVRLEWTLGDANCVLEVDLEDHSGSWLWFDLQSDAEDEASINMEEEEAWTWLATELQSKLVTVL